MLRADLIRKLQKTPASESKISRRSQKTMFEEKKLQNCDNLSKSLLNVFESRPENQRVTRSISKSPKRANLELPKCDKTPMATLNVADPWPENQRVTRSMSKSPNRVNLELPLCDKTPKATLNISGLTPRSECKTGSKILDKTRASNISSRSINFNDFIAKATASGKKTRSHSAIQTKLNVRSSMDKDANIPRSTKSMRFNLRESMITAKLLSDESPASLISSPDQSFATTKDILNTPNRNVIERGKWILYC